jgi:hypothetical protein
VMAEGRCLFRGDPRQLLPFLSHSAQLICPPYHNPADYSKSRLISIFCAICGFLSRIRKNLDFIDNTCRRRNTSLSIAYLFMKSS